MAWTITATFRRALPWMRFPILIFAGDGISLYDYNRNYATRLAITHAIFPGDNQGNRGQ
jgi:hypothetical protein